MVDVARRSDMQSIHFCAARSYLSGLCLCRMQSSLIETGPDDVPLVFSQAHVSAVTSHYQSRRLLLLRHEYQPRVSRSWCLQSRSGMRPNRQKSASLSRPHRTSSSQRKKSRSRSSQLLRYCHFSRWRACRPIGQTERSSRRSSESRPHRRHYRGTHREYEVALHLCRR